MGKRSMRCWCTIFRLYRHIRRFVVSIPPERLLVHSSALNTTRKGYPSVIGTETFRKRAALGVSEHASQYPPKYGCYWLLKVKFMMKQWSVEERRSEIELNITACIRLWHVLWPFQVLRGEHVELNLTSAQYMNAACPFLGIHMHGRPGHLMVHGIFKLFMCFVMASFKNGPGRGTGRDFDFFGCPIVALC